jgi:hypothetical protein
MHAQQDTEDTADPMADATKPSPNTTTTANNNKRRGRQLITHK